MKRVLTPVFPRRRASRLLTCCLLVMLSLQLVAADKRFTLVIDAGHGGHDAGAIGKITKEKNINLNVALAFGRLVERNCPDVKVIYTRKTDVFVPLHTRADIANHNKADLFVSIHTNALPKGRISRGLETYTLGMHRADDNLDVAKRENSVILIEKDYKQRYQGFDPRSSESYIIFELIQDRNMAQSVELAKYVQRRTCAQAGRPDKGVKQAGFLVLRETTMPSCLIELGFISTPDEEQFLHSSSGVNQLGQGIYQAFLDYKRRYGGKSAVPAPATTKEEPEAAAKEEPRAVAKEVPQPAALAALPAESAAGASALVFKVQVAVSDTPLQLSSPKLKGRSAVDYFQDEGKYKYTIGSSTNYNEVNRLCKALQRDFPGSFVIAFKDGKKVDVNEAIREFLQQKKNKKRK